MKITYVGQIKMVTKDIYKTGSRIEVILIK